MKSLLDYEIISVIGKGTFSTCFKVRNKNDDKIYACKATTFNDCIHNNDLIEITNEINLLKQLKHSNIVQYYNHIINKEMNTIYTITEYCEGGDLSKLITKCKKSNLQIEEKYIWRILYQISKAVYVCRYSKILQGDALLHRDIKPSNVFLDVQGNVKLDDFSLSSRILQKHEKCTESFIDTPNYMSSEVIKRDKYDKKSDIRTIGCLIYELCLLEPPFHDCYLKKLTWNINVIDDLIHRIPKSYSNDLKAMITFLLNVNDEIFTGIEIIIRHPILIHYASIVDNDFPKLLSSETTVSSNDSEKSKEKLDFSFLSNSTSILKTELFGSPEIQDNERNELLFSSSPVYNKVLSKNHSDSNLFGETDPNVVTKNIFDNALKNRLQAIRAHESLLNQREANLNEKEIELNKREKRLTALEKFLEQKKLRIESLERTNRRSKRSRSSVPSLKKSLDDTYCLIEPNETILCPTIAKLDLAVSSVRPLARKVTFKSSQKLIKYSVENHAPSSVSATSFPLKSNERNNHSCKEIKSNLKSNTATSKTTNEFERTHRRRSIFSSIFGTNNANKIKSSKSGETNILQSTSNTGTVTDQVKADDLKKVWTLENKKAAFEMLAKMNYVTNLKENNFEKKKQNSLNTEKRPLNSKSQLRRSMAIAVDGRNQIFI